MRFFGFGKKREPEIKPTPPLPDSRPHDSPLSAGAHTIVVYSTTDGARCRQLRGLLAKRGYDYQDIRVDEDFSTRSWIHRTTGDDALPKVFVGADCYGGFEDVQMLVFDGTFDRILRGETDHTSRADPFAALKDTMNAAAMQTLLRQGAILLIKEGAMETEAWAEPLANPPLIYYEGAPHPIEALDSIVQQILVRLEAGEIEARWKDDD